MPALYVNLMPKYQDLGYQRSSRPEQPDQRRPNKAARFPHRTEALRDFASAVSPLGLRQGQLSFRPTIAPKERFQITWFDDVDQTVTKEEIVQGVLGAGEFSLFVAKPGMGKSVLVGDIGMHIAAGMDWHGKKVKQGLVVFFAAGERKR